MTDTTAGQSPTGTQSDINVKVRKPSRSVDLATLLGLLMAVGVIGAAILSSKSDANFLNLPSILIVVCGTVFVTMMSFSAEEIMGAGKIILQSFVRTRYEPQVMARQLMDLTMVARKSGLLALGAVENETKKDKLLQQAVQMVTDGYTGDDIERILSQEMDAVVERHRRTASIAKRGSEVAPAMGLIGTLVGLVQMLADLQNPESIGPAMAVALLTTFYGALLGTVVLGPIAAKLERNSNDEAMIRALVLTAMSSIARQENPRRLEMLLNAELPPSKQIRYFD